MTEQEKQWRESIYKNGLKDYDYLLNLSISFREYSGANDDHVHCELCWDKSACMNQIYIVDIFPMIKKYGCALIASKASNNYFTGG